MHLNGNRWSFTRRFKAKKGQSRFLDRLDLARNLFPELDSETVKVGITLNADGKADSKSKAVYFRSRNVSFYVMGHELTHLLQESGKVPKGERSCDIYTLARRDRFCDESPNYVKVPKRLLDEKGFIRMEYRGLVHETAKTALTLRSSGRKRYISLFEKTLEEICGKGSENQVTPSKPPGRNSINLQAQTRLEDFIG
ncbi:MAG: hypothetical protein V3U20_00235 [Thermoplasmata archaeon]